MTPVADVDFPNSLNEAQVALSLSLGKSTASDISEATGVGPRTVQRVLAKMRKLGLLRHQMCYGRDGRNSIWQVADLRGWRKTIVARSEGIIAKH